ncbi:MAG TPA: hypothetical protein VGR27_08235 [Longimicrobiaceae bacterium]|nr:hypothetical protein [Longimicrobiaceae bacterium]
MRSLLVFVLLLLAAPMAHAQVQTPAPVVPAAQAQAIPERSAGFETAEPVRLEARQLLVEENAELAMQRGGMSNFLWIIAAVIVAGVVLAAAGVF